MDWQKIAAIGMAVSAGLALAFAVFLAWACCKVAGDAEPQTLTDIEEAMRG